MSTSRGASPNKESWGTMKARCRGKFSCPIYQEHLCSRCP